VLEGEGEGDAVLGGFGRCADQGDGTARRQRDALAGGGDAERRRRRDVERAAVGRIEQPLPRQRARGVEADHQLEVRAADRPDVAALLVGDKRVTAGRHDGRAIGCARRRSGEQAHTDEGG